MFKKLLLASALLIPVVTLAAPQVINTGHNIYVLPDDLQQGELSPRYRGPGKAIYCSNITKTITEYRGTWAMLDCTGDVEELSVEGEPQWDLLWCEQGRCYDAEGGNGPVADVYDKQYFLLPSGFDIVMDDGMYMAVSEFYQVENETPNPGNSPAVAALPYKTYNSLECTDDGNYCTYEGVLYSVDALISNSLVPVYKMVGGSDDSDLPDDTVCKSLYCKDSLGNILGVWAD